MRSWRKQKEKLMKMPSYKCADRGSKSKWPHLDDAVAKWVSENRENGLIVTRTNIRRYAIKEARKMGLPEFTASAGWCTRFMRRHNFVLRRKTKIAQQLPKELSEKINNFFTFVIKHRKANEYKLSSIGNMDETPLNFDMPSSSTVNKIGEKSILIKTTGHEKTHFTVVLTCMADGTKLPPMVIFKRKLMPKQKFPSGIVLHVQEKGWMNDEGCIIWLKRIWASRPGGLRREKSLLVWDMFRSHQVESITKAVRATNTDIAVIPGGLTSVVQPLDVSINKPFKDNIRRKWNEWMLEGEKSFTKGGRMKAPDLPVLCLWVKEAWAEIDANLIIKAFKKCGISNAMDGSEDDVIYEDVDEEIIEDLEDDQYDDCLNQEEFEALFNDTDAESDFDGF